MEDDEIKTFGERIIGGKPKDKSDNKEQNFFGMPDFGSGKPKDKSDNKEQNFFGMPDFGSGKPKDKSDNKEQNFFGMPEANFFSAPEFGKDTPPDGKKSQTKKSTGGLSSEEDMDTLKKMGQNIMGY